VLGRQNNGDKTMVKPALAGSRNGRQSDSLRQHQTAFENRPDVFVATIFRDIHRMGMSQDDGA
jgi:hypothetical protein